MSEGHRTSGSRRNRSSWALLTLATCCFHLDAMAETRIVSVDAERPHLVAPGGKTTFVVAVRNERFFTRVAHIELRTTSDWTTSVSRTDQLFRPVGPSDSRLSLPLEAGEGANILVTLAPAAGLPQGTAGDATLSAQWTVGDEERVDLHAVVWNRPKIYLVAMDGCGRGYLDLDRRGNRFDGSVERLMPRSWEFAEDAAFLSEARALLPAQTDPNHAAALTGSWPGTSGIHSVNFHFAGKNRRGHPEFLLGSPDLLRAGPNGERLKMIYDVVKDPDAGGHPGAFGVLATGKQWLKNLFIGTSSGPDLLVTGKDFPNYLSPPPRYRLGDPVTDPDARRDREGTNFSNGPLLNKLFNLRAPQIGRNPQSFPDDRWMAESSARVMAAEDPDVMYTVLADCDAAQHLFGAADRPEEWTDPGTPNILWDDLNVFNRKANRDPVIDVVYEADASFGIILDALHARDTYDESFVVLLSDHGLETVMDDALDVGELLLAAGIKGSDIDEMLSGTELVFLHLANPAMTEEIESILESYELFHPVLQRNVRPFLVMNRQEMDSGMDGTAGLVAEDARPGNKRGELYSEWAIDFPVDDNSKVRWPDIMVFNQYRFQNVLLSTQDLTSGLRGPKNVGHHGGTTTTEIPLAIRGPGIRPGLYTGETTLVDIAPTFYELTGLVTPDHVDGAVLERILEPATPASPF